MAFSPDGKTLAGAGYNGAVRLWNPTTRKPSARFAAHNDVFSAVAFSPVGKTLAFAGFFGDRGVRLWSPKLRGHLTGPTGPLNALAFSGASAVSGGHWGSRGQRPPRLSMARAMSASGVRNP